MVKIHKNIAQRSFEWFELRRGKMTGSKIKNIISHQTLKLKTRSIVQGHASKVIAEILTGMASDIEGFQSDAMQWGEDHEDELRELISTDKEVDTPVAFIENSEFKYFGMSPDYCVFDGDKLTHVKEFKCPNSDTHVKYIISEGIPPEYYLQTILPMVLCDTVESVEFISYDPRNSFNPLYRKTVSRAYIEDDLTTLKESMNKFELGISRYLSKKFGQEEGTIIFDKEI